MRTRVLVVEDEWIIAESISRSLSALGYDVQDVCSSGNDAVARAALRRPDVVLMDIRLKGDIDGIEAADRIRADCDIPVIFLTAFGDDATLDRAKRARPEGFLLKPFKERELKVAIETAMYRFKAAHPAQGGASTSVVAGVDGPIEAVLTPRERNVLQLVACGMTSKEVAEQLGISPRTVETHRGHVMEKLHLRSAADLVCFAVRHSRVP